MSLTVNGKQVKSASDPRTKTEAKAEPARKSAAPKQKTTLNNGYLGSRIDEERSEMRYVV